MKKTTMRCVILMSLTLGVLFACLIFFITIFYVRPIVLSPFTFEPMVFYAVDVENPGLFGRYADARYKNRHLENHVYLLGVFRDGNVITGEEVTHKINAYDLISLLSNTMMRRTFNAEGSMITWNWSIYIEQNRSMHIILGSNHIAVMPGRSYIIYNGDEIESLLNNMMTKKESIVD